MKKKFEKSSHIYRQQPERHFDLKSHSAFSTIDRTYFFCFNVQQSSIVLRIDQLIFLPYTQVQLRLLHHWAQAIVSFKLMSTFCTKWKSQIKEENIEVELRFHTCLLHFLTFMPLSQLKTIFHTSNMNIIVCSAYELDFNIILIA